MSTHDDPDQAELLPGRGGDVDHGATEVEEGGRGPEEEVEEDREGVEQAESPGELLIISYSLIHWVATDDDDYNDDIIERSVDGPKR